MYELWLSLELHQSINAICAGTSRSTPFETTDDLPWLGLYADRMCE